MPAVAGIGLAAEAGVGVGAEAALPAVAATTAAESALPAFGLASDAELAAAAATPDLAATGLETANATFGAFNPELFAANTADVAAGGVGAEAAGFGVGATPIAGAAEGVTGAAAGAVPGGGFFGGIPGDLTSGVGLGSEANLGTSFTGQNIGDVFTGGQGVGGAGQTSIFGNTPGTPPGGGATGSWADFPGGENIPGGQGFGAADQIVSSDTGIVETGGGLPSGSGGASLGNTINVPSALTPASQNVAGGLTGGSIQAGGVQDIATQFGDLSSTATTPASFSESFATNPIAGDFSALQGMTPGNPEFGTNFATPSDLAMTGPTAEPSLLATTRSVGVPAAAAEPFGGGFSTTDVSALPSETAVQTAYAPLNPAAQPLPPPTNVASVGPAATPTNTNPIPAATNVPSSPAAVANAPAAAPGGIDPLTGLRMGAAGASIISSGINIANALNQPAYTALQPQAYPGSPFNPQPNAPGFPANNQVGGGIAGGLAANRLANGLLNGATPRQLALTGLISPDRATRLQGTYSGITQAYARQLGVSPQSLSPGVKQIIAARALADSGLGGR